MYYLEWLPYRLSGNRSATAMAVLVWWNGAWLALLTWMLVRRGMLGLAGLVLVAVVVVGVRAEGAPLVSPWNPHFAVVPAVVLTFAAWRVICGERSLLPAVTGAALLAVGMHLAYLPTAAVLVVLAFGATLIRSRGDRTGLRRGWAPTAAVAAIIVAPAVIDLLLHGRAANAWRIVSHYAEGGATRLDPAQVVKLLSAELAVLPTWLTGEVAYDIYTYRPPLQFPWLLVIAIPVVVLAWRRRAREELLLLLTAGTLLAAATLGLLAADDTAFKPWYVLVMHVAGAIAWVAVAWSAACSLWTRVGRAVPRVVGVATTMVVLVAASVIAIAQRMPAWMGEASDTVVPLVQAAVAVAPPDGPVVVDAPFAVDGYYSQAFVLALDRAGVDVRVSPDGEFLYGDVGREPLGSSPRFVLLLAAPDDADGEVPGARLLARTEIADGLAFAGYHLSVWRSG